MITEKDLQEAIAECNGVRNPNSNTCIKLAAFYTILDHLHDDESGASSLPLSSYSYSNYQNVVEFDGDGEFANVVNGMSPDQVWPIVNELMDTLQIVNPRLFNSVIRKLREV